MLKSSDDTVLLSLLSNSEKPEFHQLGMNNTKKTEEIVIGSSA